MTTPKSLPVRPSLESLRKQAKQLVRAVAAGKPDAIARVRAQLPQIELTLSQRDAQLVLAREYGFAGWQELKAEAMQRAGHGFEWALGRAQRAINDNEVAELRRLVTEYPALLTWREPGGDTLLQATTSYANDCSDPQRELDYNRPECAEVLIDAGAVVFPAIWERVIATGAAQMLAFLSRKNALPRTLEILAALGDFDAVKSAFAVSLTGRTDSRRHERATVMVAFMYACRFRHAAVAAFLLDRCIELDATLGERIDGWRDPDAFVAFMCEHAVPEFAGLDAALPPGEPWNAFVMRQLTLAMDSGDLASFTRWLEQESHSFDDAHVALQVSLIEQAAYSRNRDAFLAALIERDCAWLQRRPPPQSFAVRLAVEYGNARLLPLLTRIWPLADDLPHAAGRGDLERVRRWFDAAGQPQLGQLERHCPLSDPQYRPDARWKGNELQSILDTALGWACMNRELEVAAFLLKHGADINTRWATHEPASILHECALNGNFEAAKFLVDNGIDLTIRDHRYDSTAEGWARYAANDEAMANFLAAEAEKHRPERKACKICKPERRNE